jgi:hypothetical protein
MNEPIRFSPVFPRRAGSGPRVDRRVGMRCNMVRSQLDNPGCPLACPNDEEQR